MKHLNFLSKSSSRSYGHRVTTLASTVGSPSGAMLRLLSVLVLIFTIGVGNAWGTTFSKTDFSGSGTITASKDGITISCVGNIPSNNYVTFTENNTLTISSTAGNITAIDFTCSSSDYTGNLSDVSNISTSSWSIKVDNPGNKTTVRVTSIEVTVEVATPHKVKLMDKNVTLEEESAGAGVTLPSREGCTGFTFAGWTASWTEEQDEWTTTAPTIIPAGSYTPTADENLYPVYTKTEGGGSPSATITTSLTEGKIYIFGAVKAAASSTLASNTTVAAVAFTSTASWGTYVNLNPSNTGVINSGITDECKWTLTSVSNGAYTFKKGNNYLALGTGTGGSTAGVSENAAQVYLENQNSTCKDAFFIHPTSTSTNRLVCNTNSNCGYRMYATTTNLTAQMCGYIRFYEYNPGTTTSYISVPNCCDPLGSINGSFFWTTHFCPAWPAKHRS